MGEKHVHRDDFTLSEFAREQRRLHREMLEKQRREGKLMEGLEARLAEMEEEGCHSDDDSDWEFEDLDDYYFLQPVSIRQRRIMLRNSGVKTTRRRIRVNKSDSRENCVAVTASFSVTRKLVRVV
jgi:cysteine/serine-rich nuclear protein